MSIKTGDTLPEGTLSEYFDEPNGACAIGPNAFKVSELAKDKTIVLFAVPGAFTPGCSLQHVPGYVKHYDEFKAKGVDEIWCLATNDAFVMGAWAKDQQAVGKIRFLADGSVKFTKALGLEMDLTERGMGVRSQRYSALLEDGVVTQLNIEAPGKYEVSDGATLLKQL